MNRKIPPWRGGSRSVLEAAAEFLLEVRRQPFECVHGGEDGRAAALREVAKAREKFVFLSHGHVTFGRDDEHDVEAAGGKTGGNREFVPAMAQAAKAFGANGFFFEVHPDPDHAKSDGPNMLQLDELENLIKTLL